MVFERMIFGVIAVIVGVILITSQAVTVSDNTQTGTSEALENVSSSAKSLYGLYDFIWAAGGLVLVAVGIFAVAQSARGRK